MKKQVENSDLRLMIFKSATDLGNKIDVNIQNIVKCAFIKMNTPLLYQ